MAEGLHHLQALDDLLNLAVHLAQGRLLFSVIIPAPPAEDPEYRHGDKEGHDGHQEQQGRGVDHGGHYAHKGEYAGDEVHEALLHGQGDVVRVIGEAAHQLSVGVAVEEGEGEGFQGAEQVPPELVGGVLGQTGHQVCLEVGRPAAEEIQQEEKDTAFRQPGQLLRHHSLGHQPVENRAHHVGAADGGGGAEQQTDGHQHQGELALGHVAQKAAHGFSGVLGLLEAAPAPGTAAGRAFRGLELLLLILFLFRFH